MGTVRYNFHGDPHRFPVLTTFINERFGRSIRYIADVAGGQGMLSRMLRKRNYEAEVIDPRGNRLKGVPGDAVDFSAAQASFYDLVVGLHPDQATRAVVLSALVTRTILVPCCNFWDRSRRLGTLELIEAIEDFYRGHGIGFERVSIDIVGPKNVMLLTAPPAAKVDLSSVKLPALDGDAAAKSDWFTDVRKRT